MARRQVSEERQAVYYIGMGVAIIGALLFFSVFVTGVMNFGNFDNFDSQARSAGTRAVTGFAMIAIGGILMGIGREGLAGSGVILDPEKAREDLEPWNRMTGGMIKDGADEAGIDLSAIGRRDDESDMPFDERLRRLHQLHLDGILTTEEYEREKRKILDEG